MKNLLIIPIVMLIASCSYTSKITDISFWDDNQSRSTIDILTNVQGLSCGSHRSDTRSDVISNPFKKHLMDIQRDINWLAAYSTAKKTKDISKIIAPIQATVTDFQTRVDSDNMSVGYCRLKQKILVEQAHELSRAIMVRF